jgi:nucleoside recognition membrane protein YjiH
MEAHNENKAVDDSKVTSNGKSIFRFLIPSLIGVILFMIPVSIDGEITIPVAIFSNWLQGVLGAYIPAIMVGIIGFTCIMSTLVKFVKIDFIEKSPFLTSLFKVSPLWYIARVLGFVFVVMTYFKLGTEMVYSADTGGLLLNDLLPVLFSVFLFAGMLIPLLLNFGLLELFGALLTKLMRPIFTLPGRSSIDCIASWLGDGTIGVLLTSKQYEEGYYNQREAAVIGTTFSAVSITFSLVVLAQVGLQEMFGQFYLTILVAGVVAALITPRIWPLSKKSNLYIGEQKKEIDETIPEGHSSLSWGVKKAVDRAYENNSVKDILVQGIHNVLDMWVGVAPVVMAMGTIALLIATYTPTFAILGKPFIPLLNALGVPEAVAASQTLVVGFADMFLPSVIAAGTIQNPMTLFIIAAVSVTQLIYMSEVGGLLLGSKIPVKMTDLIIIFLERTIITLPVVVLMANMFF